MKNINTDTTFESILESHSANLEKMRNQLEVYTDLFMHFKFISDSDIYDVAYKECVNALLEAILTKIDPINY